MIEQSVPGNLYPLKCFYDGNEQTWLNLNGYCQSLIEQGKAHEYMIVLKKEAA